MVLIALALCCAGILLPASALGTPLSWSAAAPIMPSSVGATFGYPQVSCPSASLCVATNSTGDVAVTSNPTGGAGTWQLTDVDGTHALTAVSCPTASFCAATDSDGNVVSSTHPTGGAASWHVQRIDGTQDLGGVSCPTSSLCVATAPYSPAVLTSVDPTATPADWKATSLPAVAQGQELITAAITCASVSLCVADAWNVTGGGSAPTVVNGGVLTTTDPLGNGAAWHYAAIAGFGEPLAVSCASTSLCAVTEAGIDGLGATENLATSTNPAGGTGAWTAADVGPLGSGTADLLGVACPSVSLCLTEYGFGMPSIFASTSPTGGGATWTGTNVGGQGSLAGMSCPSVSLCVVVDEYGEVFVGTPAGSGTSGSTGATGTTGPTTAPLAAHITGLAINRTRRTARFSFDATGPATGLRCSFEHARTQPHPRWRACHSPWRSGRLATRTFYSFYVRAIGQGATTSPAAHRAFEVP